MNVGWLHSLWPKRSLHHRAMQKWVLRSSFVPSQKRVAASSLHISIFGVGSLPVKAPLAVDFGEKTSQHFQGFLGNTGTHNTVIPTQMLGCWTPYDSHGFSAVWRIHVEVKKVDTKVEKDMDDGEPAPMSNGSKLQLFKNLLAKTHMWKGGHFWYQVLPSHLGIQNVKTCWMWRKSCST